MADEGALVSVSGRKVFTDKKTGEKYSERTATVPVNGKWYTFPTIKEDGTQMSEDEVVEYIKEKGPIDPITGEEFPSFENVDKAVEYAKARSATRLKDRYATGGEVQQMKKMYEEGGLATDGMDVDPVSGNDIPAGSNAEDVRDDVDAKLSSGEYVVPADVVKYFGVAHFEKLRDKAKAGLEGMEEDGRIGGEPVEGEKMEHTIGSDLDLMDGYATGGLVPGADVNGIIDRVKAAAMKDPSISNLLKSKGIFVQQPQQGQAATAPAVQGQAAPKKFAEGGAVPAPTTFDPYAYTPGFSIESGVTSTPPAGSTSPVQCPEGYVLDPNTNTCIPDPAAAPAASTAPVTAGGGRVDTGFREDSDQKSQAVKHDPNAWMKKYDYTNPGTLMEQSMSTLGMGENEEEKGFLAKAGDILGSTLAGGLIGKVLKTQKYAEAMANAAVLESHGHKTEASKLREAAGSYATDNEIKVGGFFDSTKTLTNTAMSTYGSNEMRGGPKATSSRQESTYVAPAPSATFTQTSSPNAAAAAASLRNRQSDSSNSDQMRSIQRAANIAQEAADTGRTIAAVGRERAPSTAAPSASDEAAKKAGATRGAGGQFGMAKGGFVKPRVEAKPAPKKTTTKKGLGRK